PYFSYQSRLHLLHPPRTYLLSTTACPPRSPPFPYTTLFRSEDAAAGDSRRRPEDLHHGIRDGGLAAARLPGQADDLAFVDREVEDRKSTRLNSSHQIISYAVFCLKKKIKKTRANADCDTIAE